MWQKEPYHLSHFRRRYPPPNAKPLAIDLFSGCGGLTLGLKEAGFRVIGAVENDPLAVETYSANHNRVKVWGRDIRSLSVAAVKRRLGILKGDLDLLAGCPPCQGFSSMRTLNGARKVNDPINDLIFEFLRFARELKPKTILMENVPGFVEDERLKIFRDALENMGYAVAHHVLDAADYGVPQRRYRLLLLAGLYGKIEPAEKEPARKSVRKTIESLSPAGHSGDPLHDYPERRSDRIMNLIRMIPKDGGSRTDLDEKDQLECHKGFDGFKDVYGRMAWDQVAPTLTCGCIKPSKGRFLHPEQDRAITLREAALLQSFPQEYFFSLRRGKHAVAALIGNALPPDFVKQQALRVYEYLAKTTQSACE